jgi:hypothetical protein
MLPGIYSQEIIYGTNQYVEYHPGTLPLILSVPHGGALTPAAIPDRTCPNVTTVTDAFTIETAKAIQQALFKSTGCYAHLVICNLKRTKLDCNRAIAEAACSNPAAETAWREYHAFIVQARNTIALSSDSDGLFIDLHGHGHPIPRIELGYRLTNADLELPDSELNLPKVLQKSSLRLLAQNNTRGYNHAQLLRGEFAFGTLLGNSSYPSVPSQQIPSPGINEPYFNGGYNTATHTCAHPDVTMNGWQMELNNTGIRNSAVNRTLFAEAFSKAMLLYVQTHFGQDWKICLPVSTTINPNTFESFINIFPNPGTILTPIQLTTPSLCKVSVFNLQGILIQAFSVNDTTPTFLNIPAEGIYIIHCTETATGKVYTQQIAVTGS